MRLHPEALGLPLARLEALLKAHGLGEGNRPLAQAPLRVVLPSEGLPAEHLALLAKRQASLIVSWPLAQGETAIRASLHEALAAGFAPTRLAFLAELDRLPEGAWFACLDEAARLHLPCHLAHEGPLGEAHAEALLALWAAYLPQRRRVQVPEFEGALRAAGASLGLCAPPAPSPEEGMLGLEGGLTPCPQGAGQGPAWAALEAHLKAALSEELAANLGAVAGGQAAPLGRLMAVLKEARHPATNARIAAQSVALQLLGACGGATPQAAQRLVAEGGAPDEPTALALLQGHQATLRGAESRNNLYFHVTYRCQLSCPHCYSSSGGAEVNAGGNELAPEALWSLLVQGQAEGFRQAVITGGEPWFHRQRPQMMSVLRRAKAELKPMLIVFRSNLVASLSPEDLRCLAQSVDKLVVSVDGDEARHDGVRGAGSHRRTLKNLRAYQAGPAKEPGAAELMLSAALSHRDIHGAQGAAVRALAASLGVKELRLNELKPIGRGGEGEAPVDMREAYADHLPVEGLRLMKAMKNCGLGTSLYLDPKGDAYPCNFFHGPEHRLGNVLASGLAPVLAGQGFQSLAGKDVDSNRKCASCDLRYLCGLSLCRVHGGQASFQDADAPVHCEGTPHRLGIERQVSLARGYLQAVGAATAST